MLLPAASGRLPALLAALVVWLAWAPPASAQQLTPDEQAAMVLQAGQRAYNEKNFNAAADRYRDFIAKFGGHKLAPAARYGLALALLEQPNRNYDQIIPELQSASGVGDFPQRPYALYFLGAAHRSLGHQSLAQAVAKPAEAAQHRQQATQRFDQAQQQFAAAAAAFTAQVKMPPEANATALPLEMEWAIRSKCDQAEMLLQTGKFAEAQKLVEPILADATQAKTRYAKVVHYFAGYAAFSLKDYATAMRHLGPLAPFDDPVYGLHARYLLGRTHHLSDERPEAALHYEAVLLGFEKLKQAAQTSLQNANNFIGRQEERDRLDTLLKSPPPDYVARSAFFSGVLLSEQGRFADALTFFQTFGQKYPNSPLLKDAELRQGMAQVQLKQFPEALRILTPLQDHPQLADLALWNIARAHVRSGDPMNVPAYTEALRLGMDAYRRAIDRAQQFSAADPTAKVRKGEMLIELGDTQQAAKQYPEAAATYQQVQQEQHVAARQEEALERQVTALQLGAKFADSDAAAAKFQQTYPQSLLLASVLFRQAENAYLAAATAAANPNLPNRDAELAKLFGEAVKRYPPLIEKYPEFPQVGLARFSLATSLHQLGKYPEALVPLEAIVAAERTGALATVPYLQADCLLRTLPQDASDALAAAELAQQLEKSIKLLEEFAGSNDKAPEAPDAWLKLAFARQRMAELMAEPEERKKLYESARAATDKIMPLGNHPLVPPTAIERAKILVALGDINGAQNELARFQADPFKQAPVAPLAWLRLSSLLRAQNKFPEAVTLLQNCRSTYEAALINDPARAAWAPLIQYHHALAVRETGKLPEARALFENVPKQFPKSPEAPEAAWRVGQCKREEILLALQAARATLVKPDAKPEEKTAAAAVVAAQLKEMQTTAVYFEQQAGQLAATVKGTEPHLRMLYEAAWCSRTLADAELADAKTKLEADELKKLQDAAAKAAPPGEPPAPVRPPVVALTALPIQPSEQKARDLYKAVIAAGELQPLALEARLELAEMHAQRNEFPAANPLLEEALDASPSDRLADRLHLRLGACYLAQQDYANAYGQFDAVAQNPLSPLAPEARYRAAEALLAQEDFKAAIDTLIPFRDQGPLQNLPNLTDRALLRLGHAYAGMKQWDQSRQSFENMIGRFQQSPWIDEARYGVAWAFQNQQQYDQAVNHYSLVTQRTAAEVAARAQVQIGLCRATQKRLPEAANAFLVVPFTYDYPAWSALALCEAASVFVELQQPEQATKLLERVVKDHANTPSAEGARERLSKLKQLAN